MRPIRNADQVGRQNLMENYSLWGASFEDIKQLWNDWEIQSLILVSFGLQVFLFLAADVRRHSASRIPNALLWLAYMTADAVAVFALGHLAVAASAPGHQLLLFWAPFVLLHLGGQDTITAFAMQDNELWRRHLLALVTEAAVASYVVSRSSWPDRPLLLAATVLMFLCGLVKYAERTWCLFSARPAGLSKNSLVSLRIYMKMAADGRTILGPEGRSAEDELRLRIDMMLGRRPPALAPYTNTTLVSDALANDLNAIAGADALPGMLRDLKSHPDRLGAYHHVATLLSICYDKLYTKGGLRGYWIGEFKQTLTYFRSNTQAKLGFLRSILVLLFPFLSMSASLVLFVFTDKYQLYSRVDVIVSYILLVGAIVLEVASLVISILPHYESSSVPAKCVHHLPGHRKQWSQSLGQYNMTEAYNIKAHARTSSVPKWIHKLSGKLFGDKGVTHIKITPDLMKLVLDKLLEFGSDKKDWSFASSRGQFALKQISSTTLTAVHESVFGVDFATSVLIWHIATDICYFQLDNQADDSDPNKKEMARNLSNYIMYLIFQCKVMLTSNSKLVHETTMEGMEKALGNKIVLPSNEAIKMVHDQNKMVYNRKEVEEVKDDEPPLPKDSGSAPVHEANQGHQPANSASSSDQQQVTQMQLLQNNIKALRSLVLPYASAVADELVVIPGGRPWDLISAVWLEMLYYIAPRCGGDFHSEHLSTGGEFVTHVLVLMHQLGPFLPPPGA